MHSISCDPHSIYMIIAVHDIMFSISCDPLSSLHFIGEKKSFEKVKFQKGSITLLPDKSRVLNPAPPHTANPFSQSLLSWSLSHYGTAFTRLGGKTVGGGLSWIMEFLVWSPLTWDSPKRKWSLSYALDSFGHFFITNPSMLSLTLLFISPLTLFQRRNEGNDYDCVSPTAQFKFHTIQHVFLLSCSHRHQITGIRLFSWVHFYKIHSYEIIHPFL